MIKRESCKEQLGSRVKSKAKEENIYYLFIYLSAYGQRWEQSRPDRKSDQLTNKGVVNGDMQSRGRGYCLLWHLEQNCSHFPTPLWVPYVSTFCALVQLQETDMYVLLCRLLFNTANGFADNWPQEHLLFYKRMNWLAPLYGHRERCFAIGYAIRPVCIKTLT